MRYKLIALFLFFGIVVSMLPGFACAEIQLEVEFPKFGGEQLGPQSTLPQTIQYIFNAALGVIFLVVLVSLIYGGFLYLTSVGEPAKMAKGKKQIFGSVFGLLIVLAAFFILRTINPQFTILQIEKKPVIHGALLLNMQAYYDIINDQNDYGVLKDPNVSEAKLEEKLQELIDAPATEAKAVYLNSSIADFEAMFGKLKQGAIAGQRINFLNFELYGLYFLPGTNIKVSSFYHKNFHGFDDPMPERDIDMPAFVDNQYTYPECSYLASSPGPCQFKLLEGNGISEGAGVNNIGAQNPIRPPLSLLVEGNDRGVYLYARADQPGQERYFSGLKEIPFLREAPYFFDNITQAIEVRNWLVEKNPTSDNFEPVRKTNYLAILFEQENFEGGLRVFLEDFEFIGASIFPLNGNIFTNNGQDKGVIDFTAAGGTSDAFGRVEEPSSVQVFPMPFTEAEWQKWSEGAGGDGCKVTVCAEKDLGQAGSPPNPKACFEYSFPNTAEVMPENMGYRAVEVRKPSDDGFGFKTDANGLYELETVSLENNVRSLNIKVIALWCFLKTQPIIFRAEARNQKCLRLGARSLSKTMATWI